MKRGRPQNIHKSNYILRKELIGKTRKEIIDFFMMENGKLKMALAQSMRSNQSRKYQIRHFRIRIRKNRDSLDYLLKHPFSR